MKGQEYKARQQLNAYVLRHGHAWPSNKTCWNTPHYNGLESLKFGHDWQQVVLQEYIDATRTASQRVADASVRSEPRDSNDLFCSPSGAVPHGLRGYTMFADSHYLVY